MAASRLGRTELRPSPLGFGCSQIASVSTRHSPDEVSAALRCALDAGIDFFDTADVYGQGDSERLLGRLVAGRRDEVLLCTKGGLTLGRAQQMVRLIKPLANPLLRRLKKGGGAVVAARAKAEAKCFEPGYLRGCVHASLRRLGTDYLDLFLLHSPGVETVRDPRVMAALASMKSAGLVRYVGISCDTAPVAEACLEQSGIDCLQVPVSVADQTMSSTVLPRARERGVGIIAREPLAGGRVLADPTVRAVATSVPDRTASGVALRFVAQNPGVDVVLAGMSCVDHVRANLVGLAEPALTPAELRLLSSAG